MQTKLFGTDPAPGSPDQRRPADAVTTLSVQRALEWAQDDELIAELAARYPWMVFTGTRVKLKDAQNRWERVTRWFGCPATAVGLLELAHIRVRKIALQSGTEPPNADTEDENL